MDSELSVDTPIVVTPDRNKKPKKLQDNHSCIPSEIKILAYSWIYETSHVFCKYAPVTEIPLGLRRFDIETVYGREMRFPRRRKINGVELPIEKYMEKESTCRVHWSCELCGLPLCVDPEQFIGTVLGSETSPCHPVEGKELAKVSTFWSREDYLFHYLLKDHVDLEKNGVDVTQLKNRFRDWDFDGSTKAGELFWKKIEESEDSEIITDILKNKLDLSK